LRGILKKNSDEQTEELKNKLSEIIKDELANFGLPKVVEKNTEENKKKTKNLFSSLLSRKGKSSQNSSIKEAVSDLAAQLLEYSKKLGEEIEKWNRLKSNIDIKKNELEKKELSPDERENLEKQIKRLSNTLVETHNEIKNWWEKIQDLEKKLSSHHSDLAKKVKEKQAELQSVLQILLDSDAVSIKSSFGLVKKINWS